MPAEQALQSIGGIMAYKKIAKGTDEWDLFQDLFRLSEKYLEVEDNEAYWTALTEDVNEFINSHENKALAKEFGLSLLAYLDNVRQQEYEESEPPLEQVS